MSRTRPGLQTERTVLAWRRSTLSYVAVSLIIGRRALDQGGTVTAILGATLLAFAAWLAVGSMRARTWTTPHPDEPEFRLVRDGRAPLALTVVLAMLCVTVFLIAAVSPG